MPSSSLVLVRDGGPDLDRPLVGRGRLPREGHVAQLHRPTLVHHGAATVLAAPSVDDAPSLH